ncbi:transcriptional regulator [Colwellia sp. MT41]|uniref:SoxR reducing system protein RseC n=1 Tax=Colwellia marinimaniae TaxID=1513592 RepID=A0ABQ0MUK3_9GAMM|nr:MULTISPECIES: SoxR reducing system RseC family protein [Colwellia]ALO35719.1 transcriptional regulator [Colwellia sp. MT41]GAW95887.1 SoxR reducing system protein RseC [Colwellia marinimaniae]
MIKELANVVAIEAGQVTVTSQIKSACSGCAQVDSCGSGQIAKALPQAKLTLTLPYDRNVIGQTLKLGDSVVLTLPEKHVLSSAGQVYLLPLFGLITFSAVGQWLVNQQILAHELIALGLGLIGGYLGYRLAKFKQKQGKNSENLQPKIIEVVPSPSQGK